MHFFLGELSIKDIESGIVAAKYRKEGEGTLTANLPWLILGSLLMALMAVLLSPEMNFKVAATVAVCAVAAFVCSKAVIQVWDTNLSKFLEIYRGITPFGPLLW